MSKIAFGHYEAEVDGEEIMAGITVLEDGYVIRGWEKEEYKEFFGPDSDKKRGEIKYTKVVESIQEAEEYLGRELPIKETS